ncbi:lysosomal alpha-mannosidase-like [Armigeres subalbatus]|uniref:lysosomal alpha-mannosidase-like n=1 Tax=Armigeres subalbatus TaxID=124917 RepID=UPI002ED1D7AD
MRCLRLALFAAAFLLLGAAARPGRRHRGGRLVLDAHHQWKYNEIKRDAKCGYESCPAPVDGMLNVHLVPHSHDDVGWLKTVDQYYYGSSTNHQLAGVQYILDSVVEALRKNPERRFIYVESAFFFKWWDEQTPDIQEAVQQLVQEGRLEFVGGAWSMNDEAASHYQSLIDQFTWGLRLLNDTFGECGRPRAGWQIDPFGHSREQASIFAQMGFDGMFFARLDWRDKSKRLEDQTAEMLWKSSANLEDSDVFTSVLYNHYSAPPGFCFDVLCRDDPFVDGKYSAENNVRQKVDDFLTFINTMATRYRSNNLIITMGDDFNYMDANMNFVNMDKLIKYTNERQSTGSNVNLLYSTPTCYLKAVHDENLTWPTKTDDFFPYASDPHSYWTGYFTSRPTSKRMERQGNHLLQVCKQLTALNPTAEGEKHLTALREAIGVMQHHDAITGTEKQHVTDDYSRMLHVAFEACEINTNDALQALSKSELKFESCNLLNISQCEVSETKENFVVTLYNPLAQANYKYVRLPVTGNSYVVKDHQGFEIPTQMVPMPPPVADLFYRTGLSTQELVFLANDVPPMGYRSYYVTETYDAVPPQERKTKKDTVSIGNNLLTLNFDENGFLSTIKIGDDTHRLQQDFLYYEGAYGNNEVFENRSSGAYIFRPNSTGLHAAQSVELTVIEGDQVQEVHQRFNEYISQVIRVYDNEMQVEFEWMVGPIPIDDGKGKEIITRYYSDIQSEGVFWTDSNGREMMRRVRNQRETWDLELMEPVAGNYYPVTTKIALEDDSLRMAVLNDRAQGGTSMEDGVIELMVHRRLLRDDAFGVGEALNETAYGVGLIARGKHYLLIGSKAPQITPIQVRERVLQNRVMLSPWLFVSDATDVSFDQWQSNFVNMYSTMIASLPANVNLLTFEAWKQPATYLVRFEHLFEKNEDSLYSAPVTLDLEVVFSEFEIVDVRETTLAANQWKEDSSRLKFYADPVPVPEEVTRKNTINKMNSMEVELTPMEIRTFVIQMNKK